MLSEDNVVMPEGLRKSMLFDFGYPSARCHPGAAERSPGSINTTLIGEDILKHASPILHRQCLWILAFAGMTAEAQEPQ